MNQKMYPRISFLSGCAFDGDTAIMAVDAWLVLLENNFSEGKNGMSRDGMGDG